MNRLEPLSSGYGKLLKATLQAMQEAEAAGHEREAGRCAEQAAGLIAIMRSLRTQALPEA